MIMLGNAMKLPGLQQYLAKNLGYELVNVDHERWAARLAGQAVLSSPQFKDNMLAFGVCYGLCLQGLGQAKFDTNLLPKEMLTRADDSGQEALGLGDRRRFDAGFCHQLFLRIQRLVQSPSAA